MILTAGYVIAVLLKQVLAPEKLMSDCDCRPRDEDEQVYQRIQSHGIIVNDTSKKVICVYNIFCLNLDHKHQHAGEGASHQKESQTKQQEFVWKILMFSRYREVFFGVFSSLLMSRITKNANFLVLAGVSLFGAIETCNLVSL